jgi:hypothetical protein
LLLVLCGPDSSLAQDKNAEAGMRFNVTFPKEKSAAPLDGRILVMLSADNAEEPRFQITNDAETQLIFGINVDGLKPGGVAVMGCRTHFVLIILRG